MLNRLELPVGFAEGNRRHLVVGNPAAELVRFICQTEKIRKVSSIRAWWLGGLATARAGDSVAGESGEGPVKKSKTDVLIEFLLPTERSTRHGVSVKTCNKTSPTNDQLFLTTAAGFSELLRSSGIHVSKAAEDAIKMFCGDEGFRPKDMLS